MAERRFERVPRSKRRLVTLKPTLDASLARAIAVMPTLVARRYDTLRPVAIEIEGGRIARDRAGRTISRTCRSSRRASSICKSTASAASSSTIRELTIEKVRQVALSQDQFGVTAFLATCTTDSHEVLAHALATIAAGDPRAAGSGRPHSRHSSGRAVHLARRRPARRASAGSTSARPIGTNSSGCKTPPKGASSC